MKKMKFTAVLAAFISLFVFSSCLDSNSGPQQMMSFVTVNNMMGNVTFTPDEALDKTFIPVNPNLIEFGISSTARRALIVYTYPEGVDKESKQVKIQLERGSQEWFLCRISNRPDTAATYNDPITEFTPYYAGAYQYPASVVLNNQFLQLGYTYRADKLGNVALLRNRVSNDTLYFDMKFKKVGDSRYSGSVIDCYDLNDAYDMIRKATPKNGELHVTVVANVNSEFGSSVQKDSVTAKFKPVSFH